MAKAFDVVIFGASGFTGQFVVEEMAKTATSEDLSWAVAGRNHQKLQQTLEKARKNLSDNLRKIEIFEADVNDQASLENMCQNAKLVINCVGPYEKYGEPVVMACLKHKTHLIDMTVEIAYINRIILRYYREAESQEVYIVSACGIGFLPLEMAIALAERKFEGGISSMNCYIKAPLKPKTVHFGTWDSVVNMANGSFFEILDQRQKISSQIMNRNKSKWSTLSPSWPVKVSEEVKGLSLLVPSMFLTAQLSLGMREDALHKRPINLNVYTVLNSWFVMTFIIFLFGLCWLPFSFGKHLLIKYPELFTFGLVSKSDMDRKRDVVNLSMTVVATGWSRKQQKDQKLIGNPDKTVILYISGLPIYKFTAVSLVQSAITVLKETDCLPNRGGIYTPLAAFSETSLPSRLLDHGMTCQINEI